MSRSQTLRGLAVASTCPRRRLAFHTVTVQRQWRAFKYQPDSPSFLPDIRLEKIEYHCRFCHRQHRGTERDEAASLTNFVGMSGPAFAVAAQGLKRVDSGDTLLSLCFDACRCPRTAAHFWATCIGRIKRRERSPLLQHYLVAFLDQIKTAVTKPSEFPYRATGSLEQPSGDSNQTSARSPKASIRGLISPSKFFQRLTDDL